MDIPSVKKLHHDCFTVVKVVTHNTGGDPLITVLIKNKILFTREISFVTHAVDTLGSP